MAALCVFCVWPVVVQRKAFIKESLEEVVKSEAILSVCPFLWPSAFSQSWVKLAQIPCFLDAFITENLTIWKCEIRSQILRKTSLWQMHYVVLPSVAQLFWWAIGNLIVWLKNKTEFCKPWSSLTKTVPNAAKSSKNNVHKRKTWLGRWKNVWAVCYTGSTWPFWPLVGSLVRGI